MKPPLTPADEAVHRERWKSFGARERDLPGHVVAPLELTSELCQPGRRDRRKLAKERLEPRAIEDRDRRSLGREDLHWLRGPPNDDLEISNHVAVDQR